MTDTQPENGVLRLDRTGPVATLTLNRPAVGNAIDVPLAEAFLEAALACDRDDAIRAVVLTGAGNAFCVGGDVRAFGQADEGAPAVIKRLTASLHTALVRLLRMEKPLITAVNGAAAGAGFGLAIMGDVAIAARSAQFTMAYGALGVTPDAGATWLLPRLVGLRQAQRLALSGERIDAREAERIGLVTRIVDDGKLLEDAHTTAERMARGAIGALAGTRALLLTSTETSLETQLEREAQGISAASAHAEGREGIGAFLGKRKPDFAVRSIEQ